MRRRKAPFVPYKHGRSNQGRGRSHGSFHGPRWKVLLVGGRSDRLTGRNDGVKARSNRRADGKARQMWWEGVMSGKEGARGNKEGAKE